MAEIFISYRREDSEGWAGRLAEALQRAYGEEAVFFDLESIAAAADWQHAIAKCLDSCRLMIVIIGPRWLTTSDSSGRRRLDDPEDIVRLETVAAIARHIPILTLLVGNAVLPKPTDLPDDLRGILAYQAQELPTRRWKREIESLMLSIAQLLGRDPRLPKAQSTIKVGEETVIEGGSVGDLAGYKGRETPEHFTAMEVATKARLKNAKVGDIVGVKITGENTRK